MVPQGLAIFPPVPILDVGDVVTSVSIVAGTLPAHLSLGALDGALVVAGTPTILGETLPGATRQNRHSRASICAGKHPRMLRIMNT